MTTYQDPPLQSRRASRQGERPEAQPSSPFAPPQVPRTAAGAGEPLSYVTQNRPPLPGYDGAPAHGRRASEPAPQPAAPETSTPQSFRPRDYSPEARTAPPAWAPEYDRDSGVLDHHTQARASVVPPSSGSLAASLASEPTEQTLSRRELRAIRDAAGIAVAPETTPVIAPQQVQAPQPPSAYAPPVAPPPVAPQPVAQPQPVQQAPQSSAPVPAPSTQLDSAMAEFDALAGRSGAAPSRRAGRRAAPQSDVAPEDGLGAFDALFTPPADPGAPAAPASQTAAPSSDSVALPAEPAPMAPAQFQPAQFPPAPVEPVVPDSRHGGKQQYWNLAGEAYQSEHGGRVGEAVGQPDHGDLLHPGADKGDILPHEEYAKIFVFERAEDRFDRAERETRAIIYRQHADQEKGAGKEGSAHGDPERAQGKWLLSGVRLRRG